MHFCDDHNLVKEKHTFELFTCHFCANNIHIVHMLMVSYILIWLEPTLWSTGNKGKHSFPVFILRFAVLNSIDEPRYTEPEEDVKTLNIYR